MFRRGEIKSPTNRSLLLRGSAAALIGIILGIILLNIGGMPRIMGPETSEPAVLLHLGGTLGSGVFNASVPELTVVINASGYDLPVDLSKVEGYKDLKTAFSIADTQEELLRENGFVVLRLERFETLGEAYEFLIDLGLPLLVTTDSVLHAYHVLFDETLKRVEMNELIDKLNGTLATLLERSLEGAQNLTGTQLEEPMEMVVTYLEVACALINENFAPSSPQALAELELISKHQDIVESPIFGYEEDYTQYVPRGHYTENSRLEAYFRTMMWLGRMRFSLVKVDTEQIDVTQTRAAILLTWLMKSSEVYEDWARIYIVTKFFVGASDDLTFQDYLTVLESMKISENEQLYDSDVVITIAQRLLEMNRAKILGTYAETYPLKTQEKELERVLSETSGLRFMGQRFIPDSYMFQQLVYPQVGTWTNPRLFPKGLDVPAVLGSKVAEEILNKTETKYENYTVQLHKLRETFRGLSEANWTRNLYWSWLYTLNTTQQAVTESYPTFMRTKAWSYEKLQTFAGSWTELRHDTILYAKQSYTPKLVGLPESNTAYVEPYPQTYLRLMALINMTVNGLTKLELISPDVEGSLQLFGENLNLFLNASIMELEGIDLPESMQSRIRQAAKQFSRILDVASDKTQKVTIAADVHTDPNTERVLEEALGRFNFVIIVYADADGNLYASAGPVYNYFEFTQPMNRRLTDEDWVELLQAKPPEPPEWTATFAP